MNEFTTSVCSIVLAGGKSRRLGHNKQLETVGGQNIIKRVIDILAPLSERVLLVTSQNEATLPLLTGSEARVNRLSDIFPDKGTLGGIYTGLKSSSCFYNFVAGCDMPFLNPELIKYLIRISNGFDLVIPRINAFLEPLHAIYSQKCIPFIEKQIVNNKFKVSDLTAQANTRFVDEEEIGRFDSKHLSFFNVNTLHDLQSANRIAGEKVKELGPGGILCRLV